MVRVAMHGLLKSICGFVQAPARIQGSTETVEGQRRVGIESQDGGKGLVGCFRIAILQVGLAE